VAEPWSPTPEQEAAIAVEGSAVVRAAAGSGKTAVLAHRFVHLLRPRADGGPPFASEVGEILAVTFTEKAAAEMKRKIRDVVSDELARASAALRPHWARVQRDLLGAQVGTIHAFCARLLRENPLEAGVDPRATVLDEHESRAFVETAVEEALVARVRAGDRAARELVLRRELAGGRTGGAVGVCADFLAKLARTGRDAAWLEAATAAQAACAPDAAHALRDAATRVVAAVEAKLAAGGRGLDTLAVAWPAWRARLERLGPETPLEDVVALRDLRDVLARARLAGAVNDDLRVDEGRIRGALGEAYGVIRAAPENARLARLVGEVAAHVGARKREESVLTFDDLVAEARTVLARHPAVRARYARRFRAILVDEFQDTDRVQADVIRLLGSATPAPAVFVVGDEKQSIYRFRGADVSVFRAVRAEVGRELTLGTNFRSRPGILHFVNALAERMFVPPAGEVAEHWTGFAPADRLVPDREAGDGAPVRLVSFVGTGATDVAGMRELEARALAGVVERLHVEDRVAYGDVAILFRAFTEVKTYENALRRREIPYYVVKGRGFFQCQEVSDVVSLLAAVLDPRDEIALAAALRSPLFALDDAVLWRLASPAGAEKPSLARRFRTAETFADLGPDAMRAAAARDVLGRLRRLARRATVAESIEAVCAATDFEAVCLTQFQGAQKVANVRKLIELAREWERKRLFSLRDFVSAVRRLAETEPREPEAALAGEQHDVVRLMTIHQAKGLEFRVVVVPDLGRQAKPDWTVPALDDELGVVSGPVDATGWMAVGHAGLEEHRRREIARERAELARLLYVACTRARDVLVLLEGKGDERHLRGGGGDAFLWCHQVWDVVGRDEVLALRSGDAAERTVALPGGGTILLERASRYLDGTRGEPALPEARTAPAGPAEHRAVARVLGFAAPPPEEIVTSPTALGDFARCPRQYWYRHVVRAPERGASGLRATLLGTAAHGVLEALRLRRDAAADVDALLAARPETLVLRPRDVAALADDLRAAAHALERDAADGFAIVGREVPFVLGLPLDAPRVFLHGRIDVVGRRDSAAVVRDFKYARPSDAAIAGYAPQLAAYRLALVAAGEPAVDAELVFVRGGVAVHRLPPRDTDAAAGALAETGVLLGRAIVQGTADAFPRRPTARPACEALGCGFVARCWPHPRGTTVKPA
jgi:ATP-dependent helicase/nuclease subunit A